MDLRQAYIAALLRSEAYPHAVQQPIKHFETHISDIFLTGAYAYKIKKPVQFDFLDFTDLEKRKFYCERELKLNSRFAPQLYHAVVPITQDGNTFAIEGGGLVVEYAVQMKQFDENSLWSKLIAQDCITAQMLIEITDTICIFHRTAESKPSFWSYETVHKIILDNVSVFREFVPQIFTVDEIDRLESLLERFLLKNESLIAARTRTHVRALHGDLHLNNICMFEGRPTLFDGIEFNENYSNCDCMADLAFLLMDLQFRSHETAATLVLNRYLEQNDDYDGLPLLNLYIAYRAAVRAKVNCLSLPSAQSEMAHQELVESAQKYFSFAVKTLSEPASGTKKIIAIGGLSGSGKSTIAQSLALLIQGIRVNSDAVRKHLCGVSLTERAPSSTYDEAVTKRTYEALLLRARAALTFCKPVIMDATFIEVEHRRACEHLAADTSASLYSFWCMAPEEIISKRIQERTRSVSDATVEVFRAQKMHPLNDLTWHIVDTSGPADSAATNLAKIILLPETSPLQL